MKMSIYFMKSPDNLLLVRNDRLGDAILMLPAYNLLRMNFPQAKIYLWLSPAAAPIGGAVDSVDDVVISADNSHREVLDKIKRLRIDTAFCFRPTLSNALALYKAGIRTRIGTARRGYSFLFSHRFNITRRSSDRHEADLNLALLSAAGINGVSDFPKINLPSAAYASALNLLAEAGVDIENGYIIMHPGSGGSAREWPAVFFKQLAGFIAQKYKIPALITGLLDDFDKCRAAAVEAKHNFCGATDILTLAVLLKSAKVVIANSTGPLHIAVALKTPVVGLYPPVKDCLPARWGPYKHPEMALSPDLPLCRKCRPGDVSDCRCMEQISVDAVAERTQKYL